MTTEITKTLALYCPTCDEDRDFQREIRPETHKVRGEQVSADIPSYVCPVCGDTQPDPDHDPMVLLYDEYRRRHHLLTPQEIRRIREQYGLSHEAFANLLGMSPASLYRYEGGALQSAVHDNLIRACDDPREMNAIVSRHGGRLTNLQKQRYWEAVARLPQPIQTTTWSEQWGQPNEYNGQRLLSYARFAAMVRCLCDVSGGIFTTKLNKLTFYADFLAFKKLGRSISGSPYRAIQYGPVPSDFGALVERLVQDDFVAAEEVEFERCSGTRYTAGPNQPSLDDPLSADELKIIQAVARQFHHATAGEICERSHREAAWIHTPQKKLISYRFADELSLDA